MKISFSDDLYLFIREQTETGAYTSTSEYVRALVRDDYANNGGRKRKRPKFALPRRVRDQMIEHEILQEDY